jgi:hypothetical protein
MANNERLTKRVKKMEEWIEMNEGGPTVNNFNFLLDSLRNSQTMIEQGNRQMQAFQGLQHEYLVGKELTDDWNKWLKEKDDAVQKQKAEEVPAQEEAESSEEVKEASK